MVSSSWKKGKLGDIITFQRGFDITKQQQEEGPYPVVSSSGINSYHSVYKIKGPGVIVGRKGSLGKTYFVTDNYWPHDTTLWVKDFHNNDPRFCFYFLKTMGLEHYDVGASNPTLNRNHLHSIEVKYPSLALQHRIASILSAYDDLIENNTRRIAILEEIARRIYHEWFVRFRFPGHEKVKRVESELGPIPEGWEIGNIQGILKNHIGGGWGKDIQTESYPKAAYVIRGTDIPHAKHMQITSCPFRFHKPSNFKARKLFPGDIIFEVSGGSHGQSVGRALLVSDRLLSAFHEDVICASFCKRLTVDVHIIKPLIFFLYLQEIYENGQIDEFQVQSTGIKNFQFKPFLEKALIVIPPTSLQSKFVQITNPLMELSRCLGLKNANLRTQRDLLLPKLISGEIDVSELGNPATESQAA